MTSDAIAAVTHLLAEHLARSVAALAGTSVTTLPPDVAQPGPGVARLNLFLVQVVEDPAPRNIPVRRVGPPDGAVRPLALTFQYLVTCLGRDDLEERGSEAHRMLGAVLRLLHDEPVLPPARIRRLEGDLADQVDEIRLRVRPLTLEDIGRLWPAFGVPYRLSVVLEASCVLGSGGDGVPA